MPATNGSTIAAIGMIPGNDPLLVGVHRVDVRPDQEDEHEDRRDRPGRECGAARTALELPVDPQGEEQGAVEREQRQRHEPAEQGVRDEQVEQVAGERAVLR